MKATSKKGQVSLGSVPDLVITLGVLALVIAVLSLVLVDFRDSQANDNCNSGFTYNTTGGNCYNTSNTSAPDSLGRTQVYNVSTDGLTSIDNVSNQVPTVGTILVAAVLLGLIVTAFVFFNRR